MEDWGWRVSECWKDKWIVGIEGLQLKCSQIPADLSDLKVVNLIEGENRQWNLESVNQHIYEVEASRINAICIPREVNPVRIVWALVSKGEYSVKSGYHAYHEDNSCAIVLPQKSLHLCGKVFLT